MWAVMCVRRHVCHTQAQSCLSTGWALNRCFAWVFGTAAVLAQGGGGVLYCTVYCAVLCCTVYCTVLSCTVLSCTLVYCTVMSCTVL